MNRKNVNRSFLGAVAVIATLFAIFPLTDTDIWWHLACAREWVNAWTPVREPVVNVHEYFQQIVAFVYGVHGAKLLVAFKAVLWGIVFVLFLRPTVRSLQKNVFAYSIGVKQSIVLLAFFAALLFVFRFHFEMRPVVFSLVFLGVYWNVLPWLFEKSENYAKHVCVAVFVLAVQWIWCKCQGLFVLGPIFASIVLGTKLFELWKEKKEICTKCTILQFFFVMLLFAIPFMHSEGLNLFLYPFGLLDRLLGTSPSAAIFASEIAENRSPFTLLMAGENVLESVLMVVLCVFGLAGGIWNLVCENRARDVVRGQSLCTIDAGTLWLVITSILALVAERNFVLFLPVFFTKILAYEQTSFLRMIFLVAYRLQIMLRHYLLRNSAKMLFCNLPNSPSNKCCLFLTVFIAFLLGLWCKSLLSYDSSIAYQRVPVAAAEWMKIHPHQGRLFNDDRAGGYLAFTNPSDSIFIDGRFILKTAVFFQRYLEYSESPQLFLHDADSLSIDRVVLPLRYYARWNKLIATLDSAENWHVAYRDSFFVVIDRAYR